MCFTVYVIYITNLIILDNNMNVIIVKKKKIAKEIRK